MSIPQPIGPEEIVFSGKMLEVVHQKMDIGGTEVTFERARRAPGVRLIIPSADRESLLLTQEHRSEIGGDDFRLPGGKVFDSLAEYKDALTSGADMKTAAHTAALKELAEETGLTSQSLKLVSVSHAGATVEWDLYYYLVQEFTEVSSGQSLEAGEEIEVLWLPKERVRDLCLHGDVKEDRSVAAILKYIG
ncbi:NUDIX domain-containing protein [Candidatus Pacebacteria bacterium]|nr:NUDIX domain-containing protein [Candidatus Paceibacterota bacterium]